MAADGSPIRVMVSTPYEVDCPTVRSRLIPLCQPLVERGYDFTFLVLGEGTVEFSRGITCRGYGNYLELLRIIFELDCDKTDLILACKPYSVTGLASYLIAKLRGLAYVLDVDDRTFPSEINKWWRLPLYFQEWCSEHFLMRVRPRTVVASRALAAYWGNHAIYIPNSADLNRFARGNWDGDFICERFGIQSPVVIWPAVFFQETDREYVLDIFGRMREKGSNIALLIVGDGEFLPRIKEKVRSMGLSHVVFTGRVPHDEMPHYYASADAGILPLRNNHYDACKGPIKLYEYMAMELPVIATAVGEPKTMLTVANCGVAIPFAEPGLAAELIIELFSVPAKLGDLGKSGRQFLAKQQTFGHLADRLENVFEKAFDDTKTRRSISWQSSL